MTTKAQLAEAVAVEAQRFLAEWFPKTDRFIEATLALDEALNRWESHG